MTVPSESLAILIWRRVRPMPGWDQASQAESGENARSRTGPFSERTSSVTVPGEAAAGGSSGSPSSSSRGASVGPSPVAISSSRPSWAATASVEPSGEQTSSCTRPTRPAASRRPPASSTEVRRAVGRPGSGAISMASSPSASVT